MSAKLANKGGLEMEFVQMKEDGEVDILIICASRIVGKSVIVIVSKSLMIV
jgi:hypothetical protein